MRLHSCEQAGIDSEADRRDDKEFQMVLWVKGEECLAPGFQGSPDELDVIYPVVWRHWELEGSTLLPQGQKPLRPNEHHHRLRKDIELGREWGGGVT